MAKTAQKESYKNSVVVKGEMLFFVKKAGKSFGVLLKDKDGDEITKLYGNGNRKIRSDRDETIFGMIGSDGREDVVAKRSGKGSDVKSQIKKLDKKAKLALLMELLS
uniref:Uncharacterized protein n=1 Tax=viral metagenome TaxID=1070528 RepID=A0A6M3JI57_9ZZZZ